MISLFFTYGKSYSTVCSLRGFDECVAPCLPHRCLQGLVQSPETFPPADPLWSDSPLHSHRQPPICSDLIFGLFQKAIANGFLHLQSAFEGQSALFCVSILGSPFIAELCRPLYGCTMVCFSVLPLKDTRVFFQFVFLNPVPRIKWLQKFAYGFLSEVSFYVCLVQTGEGDGWVVVSR